MKSVKQILISGIVFITIFSILFIDIRMEYKNNYDKTEKEILGVSDILKIHKLNFVLKSIRGLNQLDKSKVKSLKEMLSISDEEILLEINSLNDENLTTLYRELMSSQNLSKNESYLQYTRILSLLDKKRFDVADKSYLLFEPEREVYFLMTVAVLNIPDSIEYIGRVRALGTGMLTDKSTKEKDIILLQNNIQQFLNTIDKIRFILSKLSSSDSSKLNFLIDSIMTDFYDVNEDIEKIKNKNFNLSSEEYYLDISKLANKINSLFISSKDLLIIKLEDRKNDLSNILTIGTILYLLMMIMIIVSTYVIYNKANNEKKAKKIKRINDEFINTLRSEYINNLTLKDICDKSLSCIINNFKSINGSLYLFDKANNKLYLGSTYGMKNDTLKETINMHENVISENILERKLKITDINLDINLGNVTIKATKLITMPIIEFKNSIGTVQLLFDNEFKNTDIKFLQEVVSLMASYIFKAQKDDEVTKYLKLIDKNILISKTDLDGNITEVSEEFCNMSQYSKDELIDKTHAIVRHEDTLNATFKNMWDTIKKGQTWRGEIKNRKKDGGFYWVDSVISPDLDINGNIIGYTALRTDITDKKKVEEIAITDALTSLYNRRHFDNIFKQQIDISKRAKGLLAFVLIDIDHFKQYNDTYGHQDGDTALKLVASALKKTLKRPDDYTFRLGGEEFGLLYHIANEDDGYNIADIARQNIENLKIQHSGNSASKYVTISSGLYIVKQDDLNTEDEIYKKSDEALYIAKQSGRNKISIAKDLNVK